MGTPLKNKKSLEIIDIQEWESNISPQFQDKATLALEEGKVIFLPSLNFSLNNEEETYLNPCIVDPKSKNISFDLKSEKLGGAKVVSENSLKEMIKRYAIKSKRLLENLFPHYKASYKQARTSFRPVEIYGRKSPSYRKDDTLLHVDSFPSSPVKGERILRIFTNINQEGKPRVWRTGEPFHDVVNKIVPRISGPIPGVAHLMQLLKITKGRRTLYDHYMLKIHDTMKGDSHYQKTVLQEEIYFPPNSTWIVYTDQVSHAAMSGQHVLEQTFYLPVAGQKYQQTSPLRVLEKFLNKKLVG